MSEKIQKVLARAGFGSRRSIEQWILAGRIKVNRKLATIGDRVSIEDKIQLDGKHLKPSSLFSQSKQRVIVYHKDIGSVCSRSDPDHPNTVFKDFPRLASGRWILIGRLDINTSGLLLITSDGELAHRLMHPKYQIEREYLVRVLGNVNEKTLQELKSGVNLEDGIAKFQKIEELSGDGCNRWFKVTLNEGRNRVVRRAWEALGFQVSRLSRIRFGPVKLTKGLRRGQWHDVPSHIINALYKEVGLEVINQNVDSKSKKPTKPYSKLRSEARPYARKHHHKR